MMAHNSEWKMEHDLRREDSFTRPIAVHIATAAASRGLGWNRWMHGATLDFSGNRDDIRLVVLGGG